MKEDRNDLEAGQGLIIDSSESLREHLRGSVRDALKEIFEQEIRNLCGKRYHPEGSNCRRAGTAPSYVMTDVGREANLLFQSNNAGVGNLTISATNIIGAAYRNAHASRYGAKKKAATSFREAAAYYTGKNLLSHGMLPHYHRRLGA